MQAFFTLLIFNNNLMASTLISYYQKQSQYTECSKLSFICEQLPNDYKEIFAFIKKILIHPIDARKQKVTVNSSTIKRNHAVNCTVKNILESVKVSNILKNKNINIETKANDRMVLSCDHHALLLVAILREKSISARTRTGYAKYLKKNMLIPHWVCEVWDKNQKKWIIVDPEREIIDVKKEQIVFAGEIWLEYSDDKKPFNLISYSGLKEMSGLKYALFSDINSLFRNELLGYEWRITDNDLLKPQIIRKGYQKLTKEEKIDLKKMALLSSKPEGSIFELWDLYRKYVKKENMWSIRRINPLLPHSL